jgi:glycosyltransferase involved in cell wall biosynthesis
VKRVRADDDPLRILALAPLPYLSGGRPAFHGGGTVFHAGLLPRLARLGHTVRVLADAPAARQGESRAGLAWEVPGLSVEWFAYEHRSSQLPPTSAYRRETRSRLRALVERECGRARPDVVLVGRDSVLPHVLDACCEHALPTLVVAHGPLVAALEADSYPGELHREIVAVLRRVDRVVAVGEHVATSVRRFGVTRVETIRNVVDAARFRPMPGDPELRAELGIGAMQVVVGHVSVLRPWKRPFDIVDSAARVIAEEPGCVYLVVGDGPCRSAMQERVRSAGLDASFRFTGEVAHDDVPRHLALMDVVLQPSEREGLSLVYRETQACGRALLASDIPSAREVIESGKTGLLVRTGDAGELAESTLRLVRDPALRRRLGEAARTAAQREDTGPWAAAYVAALRRAIATRSAAASRPCS